MQSAWVTHLPGHNCPNRYTHSMIKLLLPQRVQNASLVHFAVGTDYTKWLPQQAASPVCLHTQKPRRQGRQVNLFCASEFPDLGALALAEARHALCKSVQGMSTSNALFNRHIICKPSWHDIPQLWRINTGQVLCNPSWHE